MVKAKTLRCKEGDLILAFAHGGLYEAKILKVFRTENRKVNLTFYFVHYQGWKPKWDEWIPPSVVIENNKTNQERLKRYLEAKQGQRKRKAKDSIKDAESKSSKNESQAVVDIRDYFPEAPEEENNRRLNVVKITLTSSLEDLLLKDWERITQQQRLLKLPRKPNVHALLTEFLKAAKKKKMPKHAELALQDIVDGLQDYFDRALGTMLLYPFERLQYEALLEDKKLKDRPMSRIYGPEHLIRLIVKLPLLFQDYHIEKTELALLHSKIEELMKHIGKNQKLLFGTDFYVKAPSDYVFAFNKLSDTKT